jgi:Tfp pilus assembly protein PilN
MIQLNLLPDIKKEYIKAQTLKRNILIVSILAVIVSVGIVVLLAVYVHVVQKVALDNVKTSVTKNNAQLQKVSNLPQILTVQAALSALPNLHSQNYTTSNLFNYLKVLVPNNVSLNKLDLEETLQTIQFTGISTDYTSLSVFADTLKHAQLTYGSAGQTHTITAFSQVNILSANVSTGTQTPGVDFSLQVNFNPILFQETTVNPTMNVPSIDPNDQFTKTNQLFGQQGS